MKLNVREFLERSKSRSKKRLSRSEKRKKARSNRLRLSRKSFCRNSVKNLKNVSSKPP